MRILGVIFTALLLVALAACAPVSNPSDAQVVDGSCVISRYTLTQDGTRARLGGKTFLVKENVITWDRGGSVQLAPNWGLLELRQSPNSVEISLDGVVLVDVPN